MQETRSLIVRRFPALASRDFTIFLVGQFVSVIGTWMQNTAQPYLAYRISGRPLDLGLIGFASTLPTLLLHYLPVCWSSAGTNERPSSSFR